LTAPARLAVWDPFVRAAHWSLVAGVTGAWLTRTGGALHEWLGYGTLALVVARVAWGCVGPTYARFANFVRRPAVVASYTRDVLRGREARHVGHNPLGGYMIVALLCTVAATGASGWIYTTDRYWGIEWVERLHSLLADALLVLIALHVAGVIAASVSHGENLIAAMVHGRKRGPDSVDG
jgi:cytochrome b